MKDRKKNYLLFKYIPPRDEFFDNTYLRFTPINELNDPFELRPSLQLNPDGLIKDFLARIPTEARSAFGNEGASMVLANFLTPSFQSILMKKGLLY